MADQESGFAPTDPSGDDDLLAPEPEEEEEEPAESETAETEEEAKQPRPLGRDFVRLAWAALAVFAVIGLLMIVELSRISSAVNNNGCILQAQARFLEALGPGVTGPYAGLDRAGAIHQLNQCS